MAQLVPNYQERQEFWKPVVPTHSEPAQSEAASQICEHCGTDFVLGSRFCHICGADRHTELADTTSPAYSRWFDFAALRDLLGQSNASLIALIVGCACIIAAAVTGFLFTADTLLDWQAIQLWRVEWLLSALAFFGAGILLRKLK